MKGKRWGGREKGGGVSGTEKPRGPYKRLTPAVGRVFLSIFSIVLGAMSTVPHFIPFPGRQF